jgi:hypothetical protein
LTQLDTTMGELVEMLGYARPHGSQTEAAFVQKYVMPLPGLYFDKFGNGHARVGTAPMLWSCHTDTVHHKDGRQTVAIKKDIAQLAKGKRGQCLGADDGAGVWLACEMVRAGVPGHYVFHAGEEHGGLGSAWLRDNVPILLREMSYAVALDRKGTGSVITHQGVRTCSDAFGDAMVAKLGKGWRRDDTGTFTDTAHYTDLIGECSNISVGYEGAHSHTETLDLRFIAGLRDVLCAFDPTGLPTVRQPGEDEEASWYRDDDAELLARFDPRHKKRKRGGPSIYDAELATMIRDYPDVAAMLLRQLGACSEDMRDAIWAAGYDI